MMTRLFRSWRNPRHPAPGRRVLTEFAGEAARLARLAPETEWALDVTFTNDRSMKKYNAELVGHSGSTDVITFAYLEGTDGFFPGEVGVELIINPDAAAREGGRRGTGYARELALYLVHGLLHAAGEDDLDPDARRRMRRREREVMTALEKRFDFAAVFPERRISLQ